MRLATNMEYLMDPRSSYADAVRRFSGTGFQFLDACFYDASEDCMLAGENWREEVLEMKRAAREGGLAFVQAHSPGTVEFARLAFYTELTCRSIYACGLLDIPAIVVHSQNVGGMSPAQLLELNKDFFTALYPAMEQTGVKVLIENWPNAHAPRPNKKAFPSTAEDLLRFLEFLGHPLLGACWDTGHAHMNGLNQYEEITKLGESLGAVHIQDNFGDADRHLMPLVGTVDFDAVVRGLKEAGFQGPFTFEADHILNSGELPTELKQKSVALLYEVGKYLVRNC